MKLFFDLKHYHSEVMKNVFRLYKSSPAGVLLKKCSANMQFNFFEIILLHGCFPF